MAKKDHDCEGQDFVKLGPQLPSGYHPFIRHRSNHEIQSGLIRPVREGEAIMTGAIQLGNPQGDDVYEVLGEIPPMISKGEHSGPPKVTSDEYRTGWDRIFGNKVVGQA